MNSIRKLFAACFCVLMAGYFVLPIFLMCISSFSEGLYFEFPPQGYSLRWYTSFFQDPSWNAAFKTSLTVALAVSTSTVCLVMMIMISIGHGAFKYEHSIFSLMLFPAMIPVIAYAVAVCMTFSDIEYADSRIQLSASHVILTMPYAYIILKIGFQQKTRILEESARTLGAGPGRVLISIVLPSLRWHIILAWLVSFVISFNEPVMAIFLMSVDDFTLPKKTWEGLRYGIDPRTTVGTSLLLCAIWISVFLTIAIKYFRRRSHAEGS